MPLHGEHHVDHWGSNVERRIERAEDRSLGLDPLWRCAFAGPPDHPPAAGRPDAESHEPWRPHAERVRDLVQAGSEPEWALVMNGAIRKRLQAVRTAIRQLGNSLSKQIDRCLIGFIYR